MALQVGVYDARLTNAGWLGDVTVEREGDAFHFSGLAAPPRLRVGRIITQWTLGVLGFVGFINSVPNAGWLIVAAVVFSLVSYFAMWWVAPKRTVTIPRSDIRNVDIGWVWRPQDLMFMGSVIAAAGLVGASARTVSFRHSSNDGGEVLVVLHAKSAREAARLLSVLTPVPPV